jgi:hypothetical protein
VIIRGIQPKQVHLAFADITSNGTNIPLMGKNLKVLNDVPTATVAKMATDAAKGCEAKFVPYQ